MYIKNENFRRKKFRRKHFGGKTFGQIFKFRRKNFRKNFFKWKNFRTGVFNNILPNFSLRLKGNDSEGCIKIFFTQDIYFLNNKHVLNRRMFVSPDKTRTTEPMDPRLLLQLSAKNNQIKTYI